MVLSIPLWPLFFQAKLALERYQGEICVSLACLTSGYDRQLVERVARLSDLTPVVPEHTASPDQAIAAIEAIFSKLALTAWRSAGVVVEWERGVNWGRRGAGGPRQWTILFVNCPTDLGKESGSGWKAQATLRERECGVWDGMRVRLMCCA